MNLSAANAGSLTQALTTINQALQKSDDSTLQKIAAVQTAASSINFVSTLSNFTVNVGADSVANTEGIATAAAERRAVLSRQCR